MRMEEGNWAMRWRLREVLTVQLLSALTVVESQP